MLKIDSLMEVVEKSGLACETQAAFHKVSAGRFHVYIAKTKKVSRIDISGFSIEHPGVTQLTADDAKELKLGKVRGQIDFSRSDDEVLEAFTSVLAMADHLSILPDDVEVPTSPKEAAKLANKYRRKGGLTASAQRQQTLAENAQA